MRETRDNMSLVVATGSSKEYVFITSLKQFIPVPMLFLWSHHRLNYSANHDRT